MCCKAVLAQRLSARNSTGRALHGSKVDCATLLNRTEPPSTGQYGMHACVTALAVLQHLYTSYR